LTDIAADTISGISPSKNTDSSLPIEFITLFLLASHDALTQRALIRMQPRSYYVAS